MLNSAWRMKRAAIVAEPGAAGPLNTKSTDCPQAAADAARTLLKPHALSANTIHDARVALGNA